MRTFQGFRSRFLKAFTLIELLVVISIIALLISILLPALGKARQAATQVRTKADYTSLMKMVHIYSSDNNNYGPVLGPSADFTEIMPAGFSTPLGAWHTSTARPTWQIYDSRSTSNLINSAGGDLKHYTGLGVLVAQDLLNDKLLEFFHPQMRGQTQSDAGGGARRHWFHAGISKDWNKTPATGGVGVSSWPGASNTNNVGGSTTTGVFINTTVVYRGGYFGTFGTFPATTDQFNGTLEQVQFSNLRTDAVGYSRKPQIMMALWENAVRRCYGEMLYSLGDASVGIDTNTNWMNSGTTATDFNTAGSNPGWMDPAIGASLSGRFATPTGFSAAYNTSAQPYSQSMKGGWWAYQLDRVLGVTGQ
jgi:prepilin-type N-terminal cleavage/methylation domain-containing protein